MRRVVAALLLLAGSAAASDVGTSGASSLKLSAGARGQSMGDAYTAITDGAESLYWNPAGLARGEKASLIGAFQPMAEDVAASQAAGAARVGRFGFGIGYGAVSSTGLDAIDEVGNKTGSFDFQDQTFVVAAAFGGPAFAAGVSAKMWNSRIAGESADAAMGDVGAQFADPFVPKLRHALVVRHIGGDVSYISQKDPLPTTAVFGNSYRIGRRILLSADVGKTRDAPVYGAAGGEWTVTTAQSFRLAVRGGYNSGRADVGGVAGVSAGAGVAWRGITIDYAWIPFGDIGDTQCVTLGYRFTPAPPAAASSAAPSAKVKMTTNETPRRQSNTLESLRSR